MTDDEINKALEEQAIWDLVHWYEDEIDLLVDSDTLSDEDKIKLNEYQKEIDKLLKKVNYG